jgi:hypothetical protein
VRTDERAAPEKFPLNKINSPLNFMRFFKTMRYLVVAQFENPQGK